MNQNRDELPDTLYHYTTQAGLYGIIQEKKIWATEIRYLNDSQEFLYAFGFALGKMKRIRIDYSSQCQDLLTFIEDNLKHFERLLASSSDYSPCVCSFSSQGNQLSQWRAYCANASGYSMGFNSKKLKAFLDSHRIPLSQCLYEEDAQLSTIKNLVEVACSRYKEASQGSPDKQQLFVEIWNTFQLALMEIAPTLKHPKFAEECEWRIICFPSNPSSVKLRPGKSLIIPYVEVPLIDDNGDFPLERIYVGPTPHLELSIHSVKRLLKQNGKGFCAVTGSDIPYRGQRL